MKMINSIQSNGTLEYDNKNNKKVPTKEDATFCRLQRRQRWTTSRHRQCPTDHCTGPPHDPPYCLDLLQGESVQVGRYL